jgi:hypothetical protein
MVPYLITDSKLYNKITGPLNNLDNFEHVRINGIL